MTSARIHTVRVTDLADTDPLGEDVCAEIRRTVGLQGLRRVRTARVYRLQGIDREAAVVLARGSGAVPGRGAPGVEGEVEELLHVGRLVPVHALTRGLTARGVRHQIHLGARQAGGDETVDVAGFIQGTNRGVAGSGAFKGDRRDAFQHGVDGKFTHQFCRVAVQLEQSDFKRIHPGRIK